VLHASTATQVKCFLARIRLHGAILYCHKRNRKVTGAAGRCCLRYFPDRKASIRTPAHLLRCFAGRRARPDRSAVSTWPAQRSGLWGTCATQVLQHPPANASPIAAEAL